MPKNTENEKIEDVNAKIYQVLKEENRKEEVVYPSNITGRRSNKPVVCVVGMGYVGFPLAAIAASKGYEVYGFDTDIERLKRIEKGENLFNEKFLDDILPKVKIQTFHDPRLMRLMDIFIIAVPTPVDEKHNPILKHVADASRTIAENMKPGSLVILESTVNPGVSEEVVKPIFEKAGYVVGKDVFISHSPERVDPGNKKWNVSNIPRVIGSFDEEGLRRTKEFYESIIDAEILPMENIREAEAVKILENSFRDVNIAFVNEMAMSFARIGIDITNVLRGASTKPYWFMAHRPGCGVGGHCIPVDPYYMIEKGKENQFEHKFLTAARVINDGMRDYTVELLRDKLNEVGKSVKGTKVGVLGISYKENVADLRESPSLVIIDKIKELGADLATYDPFVPELSTAKSLEEILSHSEAIVLTTKHDEFKDLTPDDLTKHGIKVVIDGRNFLDKKAIREAGIIYAGIGR